MDRAFKPAMAFHEWVAEVRDAIRSLPLREVFDKAMALVDVNRLETAVASYAFSGDADRRDVLKSFDIPQFTRSRLGLFAELDLLNSSRPLRVLDIGAGPGHFLALCKAAGHTVVAADVDWPELHNLVFSDLCDIFGIERRICNVRPFEPIPLTGQFDVITAHGVCFDGTWESVPKADTRLITRFLKRYFPRRHRLRSMRARTRAGTVADNEMIHTHLWTQAEWRFLIEDMRRRLLAPGGRIQIALNPRPYEHILDLFEEMGAKVDRRRRHALFEQPANATQAAIAPTD
jgi:SAM-dependent methyltransferase